MTIDVVGSGCCLERSGQGLRHINSSCESAGYVTLASIGVECLGVVGGRVGNPNDQGVINALLNRAKQPAEDDEARHACVTV